MEIFQTSSVNVVQECQTMFNFRRVSELILERKRKFLQKFCSCENGICQVLAFMATDELSSLCATLVRLSLVTNKGYLLTYLLTYLLYSLS